MRIHRAVMMMSGGVRSVLVVRNVSVRVVRVPIVPGTGIVSVSERVDVPEGEEMTEKVIGAGVRVRIARRTVSRQARKNRVARSGEELVIVVRSRGIRIATAILVTTWATTMLRWI